MSSSGLHLHKGYTSQWATECSGSVGVYIIQALVSTVYGGTLI